MTSNPTWPNEVVERVARALAQADGKDPDAPAWVRFPGGHPEGICWRDQYVNKAAAALDASPLGEVVEALTEAVGAIDQCIQVFERDPVTLGGMAAVHLMKGAQVKYRAALTKATGQ